MSAAVHLLGIRHHGPGSARSVVAALDTMDPDAVLVEVPADLEGPLAWVGDPGLVPPVALLGYLPSEPSTAVFAPFASFSPEWQAVSWANRRSVEVRAIDLPLSISFGTRHDEAELLSGSPRDPLRELAAAAGDPDPERWWEDVIEHRGDGPPAFGAVADAMEAARAGSVPSVRDERREAHMRRAIRAARREGFQRIAVVCGAWHVPALDVDAHTVSADTATLRGLRRTKVGTAWVPWTHRRLTRALGYEAGVDSPGWYRHVFGHPGRDGVARFFVEAAHTLRERGLAASPDHLIGATRLADGLATLRGRPRPGLAEVLDAADSVMGGLDVVRSELVVGDAIGQVPAEAPQVPLARDLAAAQRSARLRPSAEPRTLEIDLRTAVGQRKSRLLHRLLVLGVPWGMPTEERGSSGTFRETWDLVWEPELSVRLVEKAGHGTTVESAATSMLMERAAAASSLPELVGLLQAGLYADLPQAVEPSIDRLADRAATDPDVGHVMDALIPLSGALRYGNVRATDASALRQVVDGVVVRVLAGVVPACASLDVDAAAQMVERLTSVQTALAMLDHPARRHAFPGVLSQLAKRRHDRSDSPGRGLVAGRATRLLHDAGVWDSDAVDARLGRALSAGTPPDVGAAFVEGFLAGSGTVLVHDRELLAVVDRWLSALRPDAFDSVLPLLRRTFGGFEAAERRQLMMLLVGHPVDRITGFGDDVDPDRAAEVLVTVRHMLGVHAGEQS